MRHGSYLLLRSTRSALSRLLAVVVIVNQPRLTIIASAVGLVAGAFVLRRGNVQRVAMVAMAGFAAALVIGVFGLLQ